MFEIIKNEEIANGIFQMDISGNFKGEMGQFYMLRTKDKYPLLSRPISIYDIDENKISFLYKVHGEGTRLFSKLKKSDQIELQGPYGNGFPKVEGKIALVGGGIGTAPLQLCAKLLENTDAYLGFRDEAYGIEEFRRNCTETKVKIGNSILEDLNPDDYDYIFVCGPEPMMKAAVEKAKDSRAKLYISMEKNMACGVGACLVCTCGTKHGNKRICKDGPVFLGEEVEFDE